MADAYRVVYDKKGKTYTHAKPFPSKARAQSECDRMNDNSRFFKWKKTYYIQKASLGEWEAA
jgi:hypothetical protein